MTNKAIFTVLMVAAIFSLVAASVAQPPPDGGTSSGPYDSGTAYPEPGSPSIPDYPSGPNYPSGSDQSQGPFGPGSGTNQNGNQNSGQQTSGGDHPSSGPSTSQPLSAPSGDTGQSLNLQEGQSLSQQEVSSTGGGQQVMAYYATSGMQLWVRYNGAWSTGPAAVYYNGRTNMLTDNDQYQRIWSWEEYPDGSARWRDWGYRMPGYFSGWFIGDVRGWHYLAMWGSNSGWSNVVPIYVW